MVVGTDVYGEGVVRTTLPPEALGESPPLSLAASDDLLA